MDSARDQPAQYIQNRVRRLALRNPGRDARSEKAYGRLAPRHSVHPQPRTSNASWEDFGSEDRFVDRRGAQSDRALREVVYFKRFSVTASSVRGYWAWH